jgi:hypothetical protein
MLQATSAGLKEQEAINFLEKKMKNDPSLSYEETVQVLMPISYFLFPGNDVLKDCIIFFLTYDWPCMSTIVCLFSVWV